MKYLSLIRILLLIRMIIRNFLHIRVYKDKFTSSKFWHRTI